MTEHPNRWRVLALLGTAFFMAIMDGTILFAVLPTIERHFEVDAAAGQWTASAYGLAFCGLLPLGGRAADLLGRRRVFLTGVALRVIASLLCGIAPTFGILIAARTLQGISAAVIAPAALSIVVTTFTEGAERNKALAVWGGLGGVGATTGLLLGGALTDLAGWPVVFLINVPIGLGILLLGPAVLPESRDTGRIRRFDPLGTLTVTSVLVLLVYLIIDAPTAAWQRSAGLGVAVVLLAGLFVLVETRAPDPLVPLRLLRSRTLLGGNVVILLAGMSVNGMLITLTGYLQQVLGAPALRFGLVATAMTAASVLGSVITQRVVPRLGIRPVAATGTVLIAGACLLLTTVSTMDSWPIVLTAQAIFGLGMGAAFVCSQIAALTGVAEEHSGLAAGLVETSFSIGCSLGIAVCTSAAFAGALTGSRVAFGVTAGFGLAGLVAALALLPRKETPITSEMEKV